MSQYRDATHFSLQPRKNGEKEEKSCSIPDLAFTEHKSGHCYFFSEIPVKIYNRSGVEGVK